MTIALARKPEMSFVLGGILCFLHTSEHYFIDDGINGFAFQFIKYRGKIARADFFGFPFHVQPDKSDKRGERSCLFGERFAVNPVNERNVEIKSVFRNTFVGDNHKFFDNLIRVRAFSRLDGYFAVRNRYVRFPHVQVNASAPVSFCRKNKLKLAHKADHIDKFFIFAYISPVALYYPLNFGVSHSLFGFYYRFANPFIDDFTRAVDFGYTRKRKPVRTLVQRTNTVGKLFGEHRDYRIGEINARRTGESLFIERTAGFYVLRNVGDMHAEHIISVIVFPHLHSVVEISRIFAVDGDYRSAPKIFSADNFFGFNLGFDFAYLFSDGFREIGFIAVTFDYRNFLGFQIESLTENFFDLTFRTAVFGKFIDIDKHFVVIFRTRRAFERHVDIDEIIFIVGADEPEITFFEISSAKRSNSSFENFRHFPFVRRTSVRNDLSRKDFVLMERAVKAFVRDKHIGRFSVLGNEKSKPALVSAKRTRNISRVPGRKIFAVYRKYFAAKFQLG